MVDINVRMVHITHYFPLRREDKGSGGTAPRGGRGDFAKMDVPERI